MNKVTSDHSDSIRSDAPRRLRLAVLIPNYRTPELVLDCLASLVGEIDETTDRVFVVDNGSGDDSPAAIDREMRARGWHRWATLLRAEENGGFAAGNNIGIRAAYAQSYLLLNSDTYVRPGAIAHLLKAAAAHPKTGLLSPRLEWPDGTPQVSCFRFRTPLGEFIKAASTGFVTALFRGYEVPLPIRDEPSQPEWTSFAAVLIRREVIEEIGVLDDGYFMYFEDIDFCRRAAKAGWPIRHEPAARVVHLRGGSSRLKEQAANRHRLPAYFYASRARYFAKFYTRAGLWLTNILWLTGRCISLGREGLSSRQPRVCEREWADNWKHALAPHEPYRPKEATHDAAA